MWVSTPTVASLLAALLLLLAAQFARADGADDPGAQAAEPGESSYYGRRHDPDCRPGTASAEYRLKIATLRMPDDTLPEPQWVGPYRELRLRSAHGDGTITLVPFDDDGNVTAQAAAQLKGLFCGGRAHCDVGVDPRLVKVLYVIAYHFAAREIVIVSGIRLPEEDGRTSNHHRGRAADIIVPGVPNEEVAAYAREFGHVGVGYYPIAGFTHVDVRDRSFFWRDVSGPGDPICTQGILPDVAREVDELYDAAFEDPRTWAPVAMPPDPVDPQARPERRADRLDDIDDEATLAAIFDPALHADLRQATDDVEHAAERRAAAERRRQEREARTATSAASDAPATPAAPATTSGTSAPSGPAAAAAASSVPDPRPPIPAAAQVSSNTTSPPTTVATALPGTS